MSYTDNCDELLISQDELVIVGKALMGIILSNGLQDQMEAKLAEAKIEPGFAQRALEIQEKFKFERRKLISRGIIQ